MVGNDHSANWLWDDGPEHGALQHLPFLHRDLFVVRSRRNVERQSNHGCARWRIHFVTCRIPKRLIQRGPDCSLTVDLGCVIYRQPRVMGVEQKANFGAAQNHAIGTLSL